MNQRIPCFKATTGVEEWKALREILVKGDLSQGEKVASWETAFAKRQRVKQAIATNNSTSALHLILLALGVGEGDEVIIPALAWVAVANVVVYCGATPVLVDVDRETYNLDVQEVANQVNKRTKAIIVVHSFGLCADLKAIAGVAPDIPIVEEASAALGSRYYNQYAGSFGVAGAFSFHPQQLITTGEGGMITTKDPELAAKVMILRNHGASDSAVVEEIGDKPYLTPSFQYLGFHYNMGEIQAAIGLTQLPKLDEYLIWRQKWAKFYHEELGEIAWLKTPQTPDYCTHSWQKYVCYVDEETAPLSRNEIMELLSIQGIDTRPASLAIHLLAYYQVRFGFEANDYPVARDCANYTFAIPLHSQMRSEDFAYIVKTLQGI